MLPIIQAFADGADVQYEGCDELGPCGKWWKDDDPDFSGRGHWRIKPKPLEAWVLFDCEGTPRAIDKDRSICVSEQVRLERIGLLHPYEIVHMRGVDQ